MSYTWAQFKAAVVTFLTDRTPSDAAFVEAAAEYVKARVFGTIMADDKFYAIHENRYRSLRRRLIGYAPTLDDTALKAAVRVLITDVTATNQLYLQAVVYYIKAEIAREVNRDPELYESFRKSYIQLRTRLMGFSHTYGGGLRAEVNKLLPVDSIRGGNIGTTYIDTAMAAAVDDLQGMSSWLDGMILQAKSDLAALGDRVAKEVRQGAIDLQHYIEIYCTGHTDSYEESDVDELGEASTGKLPDQARVREGWIVYDTFLNGTKHRDLVAVVDWDDRQERMIGVSTASAQLSIGPDGTSFVCTPKLDLAQGIRLEVLWDGLKLDFSDNDATPFDEGAVKAVGSYVQAELAMEFGDGPQAVRDLKSSYVAQRARLYIESRERKSIKNADNLRDRPGYPVSRHDK